MVSIQHRVKGFKIRSCEERMVWVESDFKDYFVSLPMPLTEIPVTRPGCSEFHPTLNTPRNGVTTPALGNLFQPLTTCKAKSLTSSFARGAVRKRQLKVKYHEYLIFAWQAILSQVLACAYSKESEEPVGLTKIFQAMAGLENFV